MVAVMRMTRQKILPEIIIGIPLLLFLLVLFFSPKVEREMGFKNSFFGIFGYGAVTFGLFRGTAKASIEYYVQQQRE